MDNGSEKEQSSATTEDTAQPAPDESEIEHLRVEAAANRDLYLRERAELENYKRRTQREFAEHLRFASEPLIRELLPVVDNLERAIEHAGNNTESVVDGVRMVLKSLIDILEKHGVKRLEAVGQPFDPMHHQAMAQVETTDHEPNHVVAQHHTGYTLHDRLLRPALVTVSKRKSDAAPVATPHNSD